ncbi:MAG: hypothetical protein JWR80_4128 [Bradyrhizobium sp.]|nr:hypothetical protein [Bradyrhizobium sp.]
MRCVLHWVKLLSAFAGAVALAGCLPSTRTPDRLYPVVAEMDVVRGTQEDLVAKYNMYVFSAPAQARLIRNEIIAQRMYAVDVQYTEYENALTREGQEVNFGLLTAAGTLGTASQLFTPTVTKSVLSGLSTVTLGAKGHYDSQILMAQTIRTIQKQMRASRNLIAADISAKTIKNVSDYPLAAALSDVEDYFNAGTLTTGIIDTSTTVGIKEDDSKLVKQVVTQAPPELRAAVLRDVTTPIAAPPQLPVIVPQGSGFREQRLLPSVIKQLQRVVCITEDGKFSTQFHTRVINHLVKIKQKDASVPQNILSTRDVNIMQTENDNKVRDCS